MNNTTRFNGKAEIYAKARPSYSWELFDYMKNSIGLSEGCSVADISLFGIVNRYSFEEKTSKKYKRNNKNLGKAYKKT